MEEGAKIRGGAGICGGSGCVRIGVLRKRRYAGLNNGVGVYVMRELSWGELWV